MPYNSKPGARKYSDKPESMSSFKMRSGNAIPFKEMGSLSIKGSGDYSGGFGDNKNKDLKAKEIKTIDTTEGQEKTNKVKPQEIKIADTGKMGNTSSRPDGDGPVTKKPKPKVNKAKTKEPKAEKKSLWQKFKDHHDSGNAAKVEAQFKDAAAVIAGDGRAGGDALRAQNSKDMAVQKSQVFAEEQAVKAEGKETTATERQAKLDADNARLTESQIQVNNQKVANSEVLTAQRKQNMEIASNDVATQFEGDIESTELNSVGDDGEIVT